ncbi:MAG TPA: potassium channel family protein [Longimicrobiaceae bacterium]
MEPSTPPPEPAVRRRAERRRAPRLPLLPPFGCFPRAGTRLVQSPPRVAALAAASLVFFELLHRVARAPELLSSTLLAASSLPLLFMAVVSLVARLLADPDHFAQAVRHLTGLLLVVIVFFAVLYTELGISPANTPEVEVRGFWISLYFSVTTFTSLGYGDYVPTHESRPVAAVEALTGYVLLGLTVAALFFLLSHHSRKRRG